MKKNTRLFTSLLTTLAITSLFVSVQRAAEPRHEVTVTEEKNVTKEVTKEKGKSTVVTYTFTEKVNAGYTYRPNEYQKFTAEIYGNGTITNGTTVDKTKVELGVKNTWTLKKN